MILNYSGGRPFPLKIDFCECLLFIVLTLTPTEVAPLKMDIYAPDSTHFLFPRCVHVTCATYQLMLNGIALNQCLQKLSRFKQLISIGMVMDFSIQQITLLVKQLNNASSAAIVDAIFGLLW